MQMDIIGSRAFDPYRGKMLHDVDRNDLAAIKADIRSRADTQYHPGGHLQDGAGQRPRWPSWTPNCACTAWPACAWPASIMPTVTGGNTNAPTIMIGEKAADMIRAQAEQQNETRRQGNSMTTPPPKAPSHWPRWPPC